MIINSLGRRKTSVARVYMKPGNGEITINGKPLDVYFPSELKRIVVNQALVLSNKANMFSFEVSVNGGGITGQSEAIRHAISRALVEDAADVKPALKKEGFMTRDSRMVERKKPGRRKARRSFQWVKR
ncbi:MAG: 30S ribosomal protein S9 [Cytophagales bacterium]